MKEGLERLASATLSASAVEAVLMKLPLPKRWAEILVSSSAAGAQLTLAPEDDSSGFGAEVILMDDEQML